MCSRYVLFTLPEGLVEHFRFDAGFELRPRFNIAPGQLCPVVQQPADEDRVALSAQWGLLPSWARDPNMVKPYIVKAETAASGPMYRTGLRKQRVLVPACGYYEWKALPGGETEPYFVRMAGGAPFTFGGILEHWQGPAGKLNSFAIMTTLANDLVGSIHPRMPVIVDAAEWEPWLDPTLTEVDAVQALMRPYPGQLMEMHAVSARVNGQSEDDADLMLPV